MARAAGAHFAREYLGRANAERPRYPCRLRYSLGGMPKRRRKAVAKSPDLLTIRPVIRSLSGDYYVSQGPP